MRSDINKWCQSYRVCATRRVGRAVVTPVFPILVLAPFDRVGVDVITYPRVKQEIVRQWYSWTTQQSSQKRSLLTSLPSL